MVLRSRSAKCLSQRLELYSAALLEAIDMEIKISVRGHSPVAYQSYSYGAILDGIP